MDDHAANGSAPAVRAQVQKALRELCLGLDEAQRATGGALLAPGETARGGLAPLILRMVLVLFAEGAGLLPMDSALYSSQYSLTGLHRRLREGRARGGDGRARGGDGAGAEAGARTGAWGRALALFRLLHEGATEEGELRIPAPGGRLFDPAVYPVAFGEGGSAAAVTDEAMLRVLDRLVALNGQDGGYRGLDAEHLGSAYEGVMGFELCAAEGASLTLSPGDIVVDVERLAGLAGGARLRFLGDEAGLALSGRSAQRVREASGAEELFKALQSKASPRRAERIERGGLFLQPSEERRRFGAHYTSRALTRVVVERALAPLWREGMSAAEVLSLRVCDPAMGSGAFLLEACRQLADRVVRAWESLGETPSLGPGEDALSRARRLVAERCLSGVDKDPLAVDLARASLWLMAGARELPLSFADRALRGDALLGASRGDRAGGGERRARQGAGRRRAEGRRRRWGAAARWGRRRAEGRRGAGRAARDRDARLVAGDGVGGAGRSPRGEQGAGLAGIWESATARWESVRGRWGGRETAVGRGGGAAQAVSLGDRARGGVRGGGGLDDRGNPPWVSYSGRAAQPLAPELRASLATSRAFAGTEPARDSERAASLLRAGGRLGLVLPTSMSDLAGYGPSREAHDALCECDAELPDFGTRSMMCFSPGWGCPRDERGARGRRTRRARRARRARRRGAHGGTWPLERRDLDAGARALDRLACLLSCPLTCLASAGSRQWGKTCGSCGRRAAVRAVFDGAAGGGDIEAFLSAEPGLYVIRGADLRGCGRWKTGSL
ncbi:MAG: hypothetical protein R3B70_22220 [Polyangiaceae bacterium]